MNKFFSFFYWLREWLSDLKLLAIVIVCAIGMYLWACAMFTFWFIDPLYNVFWIPLPVLIAVLVRRHNDEDGETLKAEKELRKSKTF